MGSCQPWFGRGARAERRRQARRAGSRAMEAGPRWRGMEHPAVDRFAQGGTEVPGTGAGVGAGASAGASLCPRSQPLASLNPFLMQGTFP